VNTGSRAAIPDVPGMIDARPLTHVTALELDRLPGHLVVLGGGFVGLEFAQAYRRFGSRVTVIDRNPRLAPREDPDVGAALHELFREDGIDVFTSATVLAVEGRSGDQVRLRVKAENGERALEGTDLLASAGRKPNTDGIGLDAAGVAVDERGF